MTEQASKTAASSRTLTDQDLLRFQKGYADLKRRIHEAIVGQDDAIDMTLCSMLACGHCLIQGVPGLAKTLMMHSIAQGLSMSFNRIQFTPDLMPSDITGTDIIQEDQETRQRSYEFVKGPLFANIVLADEINRTPPKTQAALLQAMQEREVTVSGRTYALPEPFFVLATQNPIEQEGTYPLPEAALDRFMFMVYIDYPRPEEEYRIVKQTTAAKSKALQPALTREDMLLFQDLVRAAPVSDSVIKYSVDLARASRPSDPLATDWVKKYFKWGASPRASQYMTLGAKARALIKGRVTPSFEDVRAVSAMVFRHRVVPNFNAEADGVAVDAVISQVLQHTPMPK